jgi:hypothetical protein
MSLFSAGVVGLRRDVAVEVLRGQRVGTPADLAASPSCGQVQVMGALTGRGRSDRDAGVRAAERLRVPASEFTAREAFGTCEMPDPGPFTSRERHDRPDGTRDLSGECARSTTGRSFLGHLARRLGGEGSAVDIGIEREIGDDELTALYASVGWEAYTRSPDALAKAIENSTIVVTARDEHGQLIGLARGLSDDATFFYSSGSAGTTPTEWY